LNFLSLRNSNALPMVSLSLCGKNSKSFCLKTIPAVLTHPSEWDLVGFKKIELEILISVPNRMDFLQMINACS